MGNKYEITIKTESNSEKMRVGTKIHEQLKGNQDYIDSNIILNVDTDCTIVLIVGSECTNIPEIKLPL